MGSCPRCQGEVIDGAYACARCGLSFPTLPRPAPSRRVVGVVGVLGLGLGCLVGFRWGGYFPFVAAAAAGCGGLMLGLLLGALVALAARGSGGGA